MRLLKTDVQATVFAEYKKMARGATKRDKRNMVEQVLQYGYDDRRTITFGRLTDPKGVGVTFHSQAHWSQMNKLEALRALGFSWRKLGM